MVWGSLDRQSAPIIVGLGAMCGLSCGASAKRYIPGQFLGIYIYTCSTYAELVELYFWLPRELLHRLS
jgi:hypothetical protein